MKGIFLKEFYSISMHKKTLFLLLGVTVILSIFMPLGNSYAGSVLMVFLMIALLNMFGVDESSNWDRFALSLPVARKQIVAARYLVVLFLTIAGYGLAFLTNFVLSFLKPQGNWIAETLSFNGVILLIFLFCTALAMPLSYRFGVEKTRLLLTIIFMLPYMGIIWIAGSMESPAPSSLGILIAAAVVFILAVYAFSWYISSRIYSKKEF